MAAAKAEGNGTEKEAEKPTKEQIKAKITKYEASDDAVTKAKVVYDKALEARNKITQEIFDLSGAGKYRVRGEVMTLMARKKKNSEEQSVYFRGQNDDEEVMGD